MNELEFQVRQIKQAVQNDFPKGLVLYLLDILEVYVMDDPVSHQSISENQTPLVKDG